MWRFANRFASKARTARTSKLVKHRRVFLETLEDRRLLAIDLAIDGATLVETSLLRGSSYTVDYTVKNLGSTSLGAGAFDGVFLSSDNVFNSSEDTLLNNQYYFNELASGETEGRAINFTVPPDQADGPLYVLIVADAYNYQSESSESNNFDFFPVTILTPDVDLDVTDVDLPANSTLYLSSINTVTVEVTNNGGEPANSEYWNDAVYLSDDDLLDESDIRLNSVQHYNLDEPLLPGGIYTVLIDVPIETSQSLGEKFLLFVTDDLGGGGGGASAAFVGEEGGNASSGLQAETEEGNNILAVAVVIEEPDVDLAVVSGEFTSSTMVDAGGQFTVTWTVENLGTQNSSSKFWTDTVYLSKDGTLDGLDLPLTDFAFEVGLEAGDSYSREIPLVLPFGASGPMHILVQTDRYDEQWEIGESNNVLNIGTLIIVPPNVDLQVTETTVPAGLVPNAYNPISWTITNTGSEPATAGDWLDYVFLSADDTLDEGDYEVLSQYRFNSPPLGFSEEDNSYSYSDSIYIPTDTAGAQYLLFVTDHLPYNDPYNLLDYGQPETNEGNNVRAVPVTFLSADLVVTELAVDPTEADLGDTVNLSFTVTNQGNYDAIPGYYGYWYDRVWISSSPTLDGSERYVTDIYRSGTLPQGESYTVEQEVTIPNSADGQFHYLIVQANVYSYFYYGVPEANTANNTKETELLVNSPNLEPTTFTAPSSGILNGPIDVSWTVMNTGNASARSQYGYWYDAVYLSNNPTLDGNDYLLYSEQFIGLPDVPLAAGDDYSKSNITLRIPNNLGTGNKYLIFKTDTYSYQGETNENDNTSVALAIELFAPDLDVTFAEADESGILSSNVHINYTVTNWSETDAPAEYWYDYFYLSDDDTYDGSDRQLGSRYVSGPLAGLESYSEEVDVYLPADAGTGAKYLFVVADRYNYQGETNENNNVSEPLPITISAPDLDITLVTAPANAVLNGPFEVSWTVKNQSLLVEAPASYWYDQVWVSNDEVLSSGDYLIDWHDIDSQTPLGANTSYSITKNITVPGYVGTGQKYLIFKTDSNYYYGYYNDIGNQGETDETNNTFALPIEIVAPDLVVTSATSPANGIVSQTLNVSWTVENQGTTRAPANWYDHVYLSSNDTLSGDDLRLLDHFTGEFTPLEPGSANAYTINSTITLPPNAASGYLLFVTDGWNYQGELNESNNVLAKAISISAPDLELTTATSPAEVISTTPFNVSWTVKNNGPAAAPVDWFDQVWLSDDNVLGSGDSVLHTELIDDQTPLPADPPEDADYTISTSIAIPQNLGTGAKYLIFKTDSYYNYSGDTYVVQGETDETNNTFVIPIEVFAPDLIVSSAAAPDTVIANEPFNVSWTVKNQGTTDAPVDWNDYVFWSANATWDPSDTPLISELHDAPPVLAAGGEYTVNRSITLNTITGGYLLFKADHLGQQGETNENNNVWAEAITVSAPDLIVAGASAPTSAILGQSFQVIWDVKNNGSVAAPADWSDQVYVSSDNVWDASDTPIYTESISGQTPLAASGTYSVVRNITIPGSTGSGNKYLIFKTDASSSQAETDESNNTRAVAIQVLIVAPPSFSAFQVNNGAAQRSMVTSLTVTFSSPVVIDNGAFTLTKKVGASFVNVTDVTLSFTQSADRKKATITFGGNVDAFNSLKDGRYKLTTDDAHIRDDYNQALTADHVDEFWRLFGDSNGNANANVDTTELTDASARVGKPALYQWFLDFDNDGQIKSTDYTQIRARFNKPV